MKPTDLLILLTLGALWGLSFLFIRVAAPEFGPVALIEVRVALATVVLLPVVEDSVRRAEAGGPVDRGGPSDGTALQDADGEIGGGASPAPLVQRRESGLFL